MIPRKQVWKKFGEKGVLRSENRNVRQLLQFVKENPDKCWEDLLPEFRSRFYDSFDEVIPVLADMEDPVIRLFLITHLQPDKANEQKMLERIAGKVDQERDPINFKNLKNLKLPGVEKELNRKGERGKVNRIIKEAAFSEEEKAAVDEPTKSIRAKKP